MGGKSSESTNTSQQQTSTSRPWEAASPGLQGLLARLGGMNPDLTGGENAALTGLGGTGGFMNQFMPQATGLANDLLSGGPDRTGMVNDAYSTYQNNVGGTARGDYLDPQKNPFFSRTTGLIGDDITNRIRSQFAAAGRDFSGAETGSIARGVTEGTAPVYAQAWDAERGRQLGTAGNLYGAGNTTGGILSGLDQTRFGNRQAGLGVVNQAQGMADAPFQRQLEVEAMRRGIPMQTLAQMFGLTLPAAQAFGTTNQTGTGTGRVDKQMSGADQFYKIAGGLRMLYPGQQGGR